MRIVAFLLALWALPAAAAELVVAVETPRSADGNIRAGVFDSAATWLDGKRALKRVAVPATQPATVFAFADLPPGSYAVALYHDENENATHDRNFLGMPVEGYGFTRDPTILLSPPSYEDCVIEVPANGARVTVQLKY
jgi:uncharacterized protein (DUF2141 family)